jgi:hypothetical protein
VAFEYRNGSVYYYTSRRIGGRVRRVYRGCGVCAKLAAEHDEVERQQRKLDAFDQRLRLDAVRNGNTEFRDWLFDADAIVAAALEHVGWHRVRRQWRKRRRTTMTAIAPAGELSWVSSELAEQTGTLPAEIVEKTKRKDQAALRAVDKFLDNPAAKALWGDLGRHVLAKWISRYAGSNETMRQALFRFASDLRAKLAGENPTGMDVLLAERVVLAWVFANWSEYQYAGLVDQLSVKEHELHLKRIDLANRNLLTAIRTLAKVKRAKLPDVLALVNVNPTVSPSLNMQT